MQETRDRVRLESKTHCTSLTAIDLFAGAGGFTLAAKDAGIDVTAAVEINDAACETYSKNIVKSNRPKLYNKDIRDLDPNKLKEMHFNGNAQCDILLGGPPCQGFSVHRIKNAGVDDPRNELVLQYFKFVEVLRPRVFLMENVPGLLWERHKEFLNAVYLHGANAGYDIHDPITIDARDYGVPQRRKRVFILGVRMDTAAFFDWPPPQTHGDSKARSLNPSLLPWVPAATVFSTPLRADDPNNLHMQHTEALIETFRRTPINGGSRIHSGRTLPCHSEHNGHSDVYGRINPQEPGPTMTTACINPSKGRFVHPTENHGITLRHAARFQTFPENFFFYGGLMASGAQIGNAVPVKLGKVLINAIKNGLEELDREGSI